MVKNNNAKWNLENILEQNAREKEGEWARERKRDTGKHCIFKNDLHVFTDLNLFFKSFLFLFCFARQKLIFHKSIFSL